MLGRSYEYGIENVVATASVGRRCDLTKILRYYQQSNHHVKYRPDDFPGLTFRLKKPKSATLIFESGKLINTGTKSTKDARKAIKKVLKELKSIYEIKFKTPEIIVQNIVASGNFHGYIELEEAYMNLPKRYICMYEPDQFPGLIARDTKKYGRGPVEKNSVFLLFSTSGFVCTGCKYEESMELRVKDMYQALFDVGCLYPRT